MSARNKRGHGPRTYATNIVLMGMPGSGKTTVGRLLADDLGYEFIDSDAALCETLGMPVSDYIQRFGEADFRIKEKRFIQSLRFQKKRVITTGGGAVMDPENLSTLNQLGVMISLLTTPGALKERLENSAETRPLLLSSKSKDRKNRYSLETIKRVLKERAAIYHQASCLIKTYNKKPQEIVDEIREFLKNR